MFESSAIIDVIMVGRGFWMDAMCEYSVILMQMLQFAFSHLELWFWALFIYGNPIQLIRKGARGGLDDQNILIG